MIIDFRKGGGGTGPSIKVEALEATENKIYEAPSGKAYSPVTVKVPIPTFTTEELEATENKVYTPTTDGYSKVIVNVPSEKLDLSGTGWESEKEFPVSVARQDQLKEDIEYTKQKYSEWDPNQTAAGNFYQNDMKLVYAPKVDFSKLEPMFDFFMGCENLVSVPELNTSKNTDFDQFFLNCKKLSYVPKMDTLNAQTLLGTFYGCSSLVKAPKLFTGKATSISQIFQYCSSLTSIEFEGGLKAECDCSGAFYGIAENGVLYLHVGNGITKANYQPVIDRIPSTWTVEYITDELVEVEPNKTVEITSNGTTEIVPASGYQGIAGATVTVNVPSSGGGSFDWEGTGYSPEEEGKVYTKMQADIDYTKQKFDEWDPSRTSANRLYNEDKKLVYAPLIDTSAVNGMSYMFADCYALTSVPLFDTSKVTNMSYMFADCYALTSVPEFSTGAVTDMNSMFSSCYGLTSIPLLDTSKVTSMNSMFGNCSALTTIPLLDTSAVTDMNYMFYSCYALTSIPLLDTSKVTSMNSMFANCYGLTSVEFKGGVAPGCDCTDMFSGVYTTSTFYYHLPGDYSPVLAQLPSKWTAVPVGEVSFKIRVLKDAVWLTGDQNLVMGGKTLTYEGKGIYTTTLTFTKEGPNPSLDLLLDGAKIGTAKVTQDEQIFETGDNSSLETNKVGADILTIVPEGGNTDGWAYDEQVKGVKSVSKSGGQSTLKLSIPGSFTMTYGQDSEQNYDYARLLNGAGNLIVSFKGKKTGPDGQEVFEGSTDDGIVQAVYSKDSGGDTGLDAFWIKSIVYKTYPPYPAA